MAGDVITLEGENFSAIPDHNVVLFSGIRGAVTGARVTQLEVVVPPCLPTRAVDVSVRLGGESSSSILLAVAATTTVLDMAPGSDTTLIVENAPACLRLGSVGSQGYLAVVQSASDIGAARFDYTFTGLREGGVLAAPGGSVPSIRMRQGPLWELGCLTPCSSRLGLVRARSGTTSSPSLAREIWRCRSARGERTYRW